MKNKFEMSFAAFLAIVVAIVGLVTTMIIYFQRLDKWKEEQREATNIIPDWIDTTEETEPNDTQLEETEIVFEPVETSTATPDTNEIAPKMDEETKPYSDDDLMNLAKIIENEAGSDYCTDEHQRYVASVVINRVNSAAFTGDTILEIALCGYGDGNPIQYDYSIFGGGEAGFWSIEPSERAFENARYVLENGVLDDTVVWQANFPQGEKTVKEFTYPFADPPTTYICK